MYEVVSVPSEMSPAPFRSQKVGTRWKACPLALVPPEQRTGSLCPAKRTDGGGGSAGQAPGVSW